MNDSKIHQIEMFYGITYPPEYLSFLEQNGDTPYYFIENEEFTDWEIRFSKLDDSFITNNKNLVDDANPDPMRIIPFAWSVSSGNNYLLDFRKNPFSPAVVLMDHEVAIIREDAESETDSPEEAQRLLEENLREVASGFAEFAVRLTIYND